jgi:hypothetical protein
MLLFAARCWNHHRPEPRMLDHLPIAAEHYPAHSASFPRRVGSHGSAFCFWAHAAE